MAKDVREKEGGGQGQKRKESWSRWAVNSLVNMVFGYLFFYRRRRVSGINRFHCMYLCLLWRLTMRGCHVEGSGAVCSSEMFCPLLRHHVVYYLPDVGNLHLNTVRC